MKYKVIFIDNDAIEVENVVFCDNADGVFYMKGSGGTVLFQSPVNQVKYIVKIES